MGRKLKTVKGRGLDASNDSVAFGTSIDSTVSALGSEVLESGSYWIRVAGSGSGFSLGRRKSLASKGLVSDTGNESWMVRSVSTSIESKGVRAYEEVNKNKRKHAMMILEQEATFRSMVIVEVTNFQMEYEASCGELMCI